MNRTLGFIVIALFAIATVTCAQPPILWTQNFGGNSADEGHYVVQTEDGGFLLAGNTFSFGAGGADVWLIKTDTAGNESWNQTFGGNITDEGHCVQQTSDGGFIVVGFTFSYGAGGIDVYLVKTDASGNLQWDQTFGGGADDYGYSVQQTSDGGYIIAGYTFSFGSGSSDFYLIKTDSTGTEEWSQTYGGTSSDDGYSVQQTSDGGYILTGVTFLTATNDLDVLLVKTDSTGNEQWSHTFGGTSDDRGWDVRQTNDGGFIIVGTTNSYGSGGDDVYLINTDATGNEIWQHAFGGDSPDRGYSVQQTSDGGFIVAGETWSYGSGGADVYIVKTDVTGALEWDLAVGGSSNDYGWCIQQTSNEGYIIAGDTYSYSGGFDCNAYLIRIASETVPEFSVDLTYVSGSPVPPGGGNLTYDLFVEYLGLTPIDYDGWLEASYEGGDPTTLVLRSFTNYQPGWTIDRPGTYYPVPAGWAAGNYTFSGKVGIYPATSWNEDSFPFIKEGAGIVEEFAPYPVIGAPNPFDITKTGKRLTVSHNLVTNYPDPFNPTTILSYELQTASSVLLSVYNVKGRKVAELVNGYRDAGIHEVVFDASSLPSGMYIYQLNTGDSKATGKMILLK